MAHRYNPDSENLRTNVLGDLAGLVSAIEKSESQAMLWEASARHTYGVEVIRLEYRKPWNVHCNDRHERPFELHGVMLWRGNGWHSARFPAASVGASTSVPATTVAPTGAGAGASPSLGVTTRAKAVRSKRNSVLSVLSSELEAGCRSRRDPNLRIVPAHDSQRIFGSPLRFEIPDVQAKALATVFKRTRAEHGKADQFVSERHIERHRKIRRGERDDIQADAGSFGDGVMNPLVAVSRGVGTSVGMGMGSSPRFRAPASVSALALAHRHMGNSYCCATPVEQFAERTSPLAHSWTRPTWQPREAIDTSGRSRSITSSARIMSGMRLFAIHPDIARFAQATQ